MTSIVNNSTADWNSIEWSKAYCVVKNLRQRIYKATVEQDWKKVRGLQKLMLRSYSNLLVSTRRVSQINRGKTTPGVDRYIALTPRARMALIDRLTKLKGWKPLPAHRVYIPKSNGKKRPLGIPSLIDRCQQAMVKNALEPCWEAQFEEISYGFRPGRSVHDAIERIYVATKSGSHRVWVLDADIKGCFDHIDHSKLMDAISNFPARELIAQWLKAGYVEDGAFYRTEEGTPQGGVISPLLANIALHGMEEALGVTYRGGVSSSYVTRTSPVMVRYADDFVVLCHTEPAAQQARKQVTSFLAKRGLTISEEKTQIRHLTEGFNFLGFNIRSYSVPDRKAGTKTLIKPSKEAVKAFKRKLRDIFTDHNGQEVGKLIRAVNPVIRGWCNFYHHAVAGVVFRDIEHYLYIRQKRWCKRNHPRKAKKWWMPKYFGRHYHCPGYGYTFMDKRSGAFMLHPTSFHIERWVKVKHKHSPDNPEQRDYWQKRTRKESARLKPSKQKIAGRQGHHCPVCRQSLYNGEAIDLHHKDGNRQNESYANLLLVHTVCHNNIHHGLA